MTMYERMKIKSAEIGTNFKQLERELGFGNGTLRKWEFQNPSYDKVVMVANRLNVSLDWLITGKDSADLTEDEIRLIESYRLSDDRGKRNILRCAEIEAQELTSLASKNG